MQYSNLNAAQFAVFIKYSRGIKHKRGFAKY